MKIRYMGKYKDDPDSLPHIHHEPDSVKIKELNDSGAFFAFTSTISILIFVVLIVLIGLRGREFSFSMQGLLLAFVAVIPHEILHALFLNEDVYIYSFPKRGMLLLYSNERMSKRKFIIMNMMPNIVFGFIPFLIYYIAIDWDLLGFFGEYLYNCRGM